MRLLLGPSRRSSLSKVDIVMGVTAIKRIENRSNATLTLINKENPNTSVERDPIAPGAARAVDIWIPWAGSSDEFKNKHLQLLLNGSARHWVWQAWKGDGDHVRFSANNAWHEPGERIPGESAVRGDRTLTVFTNSFSLLPHAAPVLMPWITAIKRVENRSGAPVALFDRSPLCTLALSRYAGHAPSAVLLAEIERVSDAATYQAAVLIVRAHGPLQRTAVRRITPQENERFERIHEEVYLEHGYRLIEVPAGTVAQRVRQVLRVITI